jgi:PPOX class probable FMN-dependent enzyme
MTMARTSTASCHRLRALVTQLAPEPAADGSFASSADPASGRGRANAGMTIAAIKKACAPGHFTNHFTSSLQPSPTKNATQVGSVGRELRCRDAASAGVRMAPCAGAAGYVASVLGGAAVAWAATVLRNGRSRGRVENPTAEAATTDPNVVTTRDQLREVLPVRGSNGQGVEDAPKVLRHLDDQMTGFIGRSPFLQLGTADREGLPYVSPKGDHPGFVMVLDPQTIVIPDRPGNNILMGLQNLLDNPHCGICFEIPGNDTTLRVGGGAALRKDPELLRLLSARGIGATMAIQVKVDYAFFHCAKAYLRSRLWEPASWDAELYAVSFGQYFSGDEDEVEEIDARTRDTYAMVRKAVDGVAAEEYPPVTVVDEEGKDGP